MLTLVYMSRYLFYPHIRGVIRRLPDHYKSRYMKRYQATPNIQYIEKQDDDFIEAIDKSIYPSSHYDVPADVIYPEESQRSLWGGEGIVKGFIELKRTHTRIPKTWGPELRQHIFYSEILDRWMIIIVSLTALAQIESLKGLDNYLLMTPENEINSRLGMFIKRDILLKLSCPDFQDQKPDIFSKYSEFVIPKEEAEWIGLTLDEAIKKQMKLENDATKVIMPKKIILAKALIEQLDWEKTHPEDRKLIEPESDGFIRSKFNRLMYGEKSPNS